ncbi:MAG: nitronate monooxygenase [Desulfobacterales bacterium]|jgi:NAD(P)H-dependent flavin oxidoreductase YrpB (nitropropane dioxygenase family)
MDFNMIKKLQIPKLDLRNLDWPRFDFSTGQWPKMPELRIGDAVAKLPIIQGGMGVGISLSGLASAVANEGGIGVIAANSIGMLDPEYYAKNKDANSIILRKEIRKTKEKTSGLIGVNIMMAVDDCLDLIRVAIDEKIDMVFLGAGLPIKGIPVKDLRAAGVKVIPIVSSARAAVLIFRSWSKKYKDIPDAVVVEGPKAGGHLGFKAEQIDDPDFALERILPDVVAEIKTFEDKYHRKIPVIAAGGVYTGADIYKVFKLGAGGVQMGTRFVATHECDANIRFKEAYIACCEDDLEIIKSPVGLPGRAIRNKFLKDVAAGKKMGFKCAWRCLKSCDIKSARYCISLVLDNARQGILDKGFAFAGSNAFRVEKIVSVNELLQELIQQYQLAEEKGAGKLRDEYENALEKLVSLKEEYFIAMKKGLNSFKDEYERGIEKGAALFREEYSRTMDKISSLKMEYQSAVDKANLLKAELVEHFEQYSLFDKLQIEGTCQNPCQ